MTKGLVVVLGKTGRNFAAGMSGGIAFVLDETGDFRDKFCNRSMVDLHPVDDPVDIQALHRLVERHVEYTASPRGTWMLQRWGELLPKFVKVFPHEYKRVLGVPRLEAAPSLAVTPVEAPVCANGGGIASGKHDRAPISVAPPEAANHTVLKAKESAAHG